MDQVHGLQRDRQEVTSEPSDPWDGPVCEACQGRGQVVYARGHRWTGVWCDACHGTGLAEAQPDPPPPRDDGFRDPVEGEVHDSAVHGPLPPALPVGPFPGCPYCYGAGVVVSSHMVEAPCPRCGA